MIINVLITRRTNEAHSGLIVGLSGEVESNQIFCVYSTPHQTRKDQRGSCNDA